MPTNLINAWDSRGFAIDGRQFSGVLRPFELGTKVISPAKNSINIKIGYFFSEYIRANFILALTCLVFVFQVSPDQRYLSARLNVFFKRAVDMIGAVAGLILTLPFFIILPILIKLDSPGPVFYTQTRVGHKCQEKT